MNNARTESSATSLVPPPPIPVREIVKLFARTWPYIRPVGWHVLAWFCLAMGIGLVAGYITISGADLFNNAVLDAKPIAPAQQMLLFVDASYVDSASADGRTARRHSDPRHSVRGAVYAGISDAARQPGRGLLGNLDRPGDQSEPARQDDRERRAPVLENPKPRPYGRRHLPGLPGQPHDQQRHRDNHPRSLGARCRAARRVRHHLVLQSGARAAVHRRLCADFPAGGLVDAAHPTPVVVVPTEQQRCHLAHPGSRARRARPESQSGGRISPSAASTATRGSRSITPSSCVARLCCSWSPWQPSPGSC